MMRYRQTLTRHLELLIYFVSSFSVLRLEIDIKAHHYRFRVREFRQADIIIVFRIQTTPRTPDYKVLSHYVKFPSLNEFKLSNTQIRNIVRNGQVPEAKEFCIRD